MKHIALRTARQRAGLTQQQLEDLTGVDRSWIARLETTDTNPTLDTLTKLDEALRAAKKGALRRNEKLAFGPVVVPDERASA